MVMVRNVLCLEDILFIQGTSTRYSRYPRVLTLGIQMMILSEGV